MRILQNVISTGLRQQETRFSIIANNLSNIQTSGFKKDFPLFQRIYFQALDPEGINEIDSSVILFQQGNLQNTGNELDLAIQGEGFFKVRTPNGIRYTRSGNFSLNQAKILVEANGFPVMGRQGEVTLNGNDIRVEENGSIFAGGKEVDKLALVTFPNPALLTKEGNSLFKLEETQPEIEATQGQVLQGSLEASNVNPMDEMVKLVDSLRTYETTVKVIQANDELDSKAANEIGKV